MSEVKQSRVSSYKWLVIFFIIAGISVLISNQIGPKMNVWVFAITSVISLGALVVFSVNIVMAARSRQDRIIGLIFASFSALWFTGDQISNIYYSLIQNEARFPSTADAFYLAALVLLAVFVFLLTHPFRRFVTKRVLFPSIALAFSYLIPSIIMRAGTNDTSINVALSALYPVIDSIILIPLISTFVIFYGIRHNYLWLILAAIIVEIATDTGFLFLEINGLNYTGNPIWLGFEWVNILLAYGAYRQSIVMRNMDIPVIAQMKSEIEKGHNAKTPALMPLMISSAVIIFVFSLAQIYDFSNLSMTKLAFFGPIIYGGIIAIISVSVAIVLIIRRISSIKSKIEEGMREIERVDVKREEFVATSGNILNLEKKIHQVKSAEKYSTGLIVAIGIFVVVAIGYFSYTTHVDETTSSQLPTRFIVENLKGDTVKTWVAWRLSEGQPLHVTVINSDLVSQDKISAIKNAILSEETIEIPNSELGKVPEDGTGTYYLGWAGALKKAAESQTEINIPTNLRVDTSNKPDGDVIIVLSNLKESDGTLGFTKSIADDQQSQILKSTIAIFDATNLNTHELTAITRHEFGHAIGLGHSTASEDLMYPKFNSKYPYISSCDVDSLASLYDKRGSPAVVCED